MKTQENITLYTCDFCKKKLFRKHAMIKHEEGCENNPKNKIACLQGCAYLLHIDLEIDINLGYEYGGDQVWQKRKSACYKCIKKDQLMYSFAAEKRDLPAKYPDDFDGQEAMPKLSCPDFKYSELPF